MTLIAPPPTDNRFLTWTDWEGYEKFLEAVGERRIRVTYDRGTLELMTLSREHERRKSILSGLVEMLLLEQGRPFEHGGSLTIRRKDLDRGFEPDECYWISHREALAGREEFDPVTDPPPDLALEVEVSRSSVDRLGIYAAMGIPELWRLTRRGKLLVLRLGPSGEYEPVAGSPTFPGVPLAEVARCLEIGRRQGTSEGLVALREWLRSTAPGGAPAPEPRSRRPGS